MIVIGLFVVTAYVGGDGDTGTVSTPPLDACVALIDSADNAEGYLVDCASPNDGEVMAQVRDVRDCPEATRYVRVGTEFYCIPSTDGG